MWNRPALMTIYAECLDNGFWDSLASAGASAGAGIVSYQNYIRFPLGMRNYYKQKWKKNCEKNYFIYGIGLCYPMNESVIPWMRIYMIFIPVG